MTRKTLCCSLIRDRLGLEGLRDRWADLLARSATNEVMQGPTWLLNWWEVYGGVQERELCTLTFCDEEGTLVGLAPLCKRKIGKRKIGGRALENLRLTRIEFLGSGEEEAHETCSEYLGVLAAIGHEQSVAEAFGNALKDGLLGSWDEINLTAMSSEAAISPLLARAMGAATKYQVIGGAPFALLPKSWDDYLASQSSSRRYLIRRSLKGWEKWAKEPPVLKRVEREDQLDQAIEMLAKLHEERWQDVGHAGAFTSPLFAAFHRKTMLELLRQGALWLCWLEVLGEPVAAIYNLVWNNQVRFYQSGRKLNMPKKVRAGIVIHACAMRESIEAGYTHYDFLAGTTRYKMQLANNVRPLMSLSLTRPSLRTKIDGFRTSGLQLGRSLRNEIKSRLAERRGTFSADESV